MSIRVIDNYLNQQDFEALKNLKLEQIENTSIKVYHNKISDEKVITNSCINVDFLKRLHDSYHKKAIKLLDELNSNKVKLYDYSEFHIIETGANYKFPIHDDTPDKILSGIVYLNPEKNTGTIFYTDKKVNNKKTIDWKLNRAVFFSRTEKKTWHSFEGDGISNRLALVYNLKTTRIKEVYKIEGKNYLYGQFRYKLNPFLLKYFNFTI
jgi:hypothetical protein